MAGSIEAPSLIGGCNASCVIGPISPFPDVREKKEKMRRTTIREYYASEKPLFRASLLDSKFLRFLKKGLLKWIRHGYASFKALSFGSNDFKPQICLKIILSLFPFIYRYF